MGRGREGSWRAYGVVDEDDVELLGLGEAACHEHSPYRAPDHHHRALFLLTVTQNEG